MTASLAIANADTIRGDRGQAGVSKGFGLQRASSLGLSTGTHELLLILNWAILSLGRARRGGIPVQPLAEPPAVRLSLAYEIALASLSASAAHAGWDGSDAFDCRRTRDEADART